jgi:hypothetical protein
VPFQSKRQQRYFYAKAKSDPKFDKMAKEWSKEGPEGYMKKLPKTIRGDKDRTKAELAHRGKGRNRKTKFKESFSFKQFAREVLLENS